MTARPDAEGEEQSEASAYSVATTGERETLADDISLADTHESPLPGSIDIKVTTQTDILDGQVVALKRSTLVSANTDGPTTEDARSSGEQQDPYVGCVIDGRYLVESVIARGGMGVVYLGRHQVIDKRVAIKVLKPDFADDEDVTARFLMEAKAASQIGNIRIIDVNDFGQLPDGATYLVMEYLEGQSLGRLIRGRTLTDLTQEPEPRLQRLLHIGMQIAEGLQAAHEVGIVHRDLKPDNLFLVEHNGDPDFVKILDFGIAKVASGQNQQTRAGKVFGTPHYMSPEQAAGGSIDQRTDIYALGVILYEMSSGRTPFDAENPLGILTQHLFVPPPALSSLHPDPCVAPALEAVILKCLSKNAEDRYGSMKELEQDLLRVQQGDVPEAVGDLLGREDSALPVQSLRAARRGTRNTRRRWGVILPLAMGGILVVGALALRWSPPPAVEQPVPVPTASAAPVAKVPRQTFVSVALVISPIDAHVFSGNKDLGTMPINIKVLRNRTAVVEIRRSGFVTRRIRIDGKKRKLIVRLKPVPGETPVEIATDTVSSPAKTYLLRPVEDPNADVQSAPAFSAELEPPSAAGGAAALEQDDGFEGEDLPDLEEVDEALSDEANSDPLDDIEEASEDDIDDPASPPDTSPPANPSEPAAPTERAPTEPSAPQDDPSVPGEPAPGSGGVPGQSSGSED